MGDFIKNKPAWTMASVQAIVVIVLNLILEFGVDLTASAVSLINALVIAVLALALGLWAQSPIEHLIEEAEVRGRAAATKQSK